MKARLFEVMVVADTKLLLLLDFNSEIHFLETYTQLVLYAIIIVLNYSKLLYNNYKSKIYITVLYI